MMLASESSLFDSVIGLSQKSLSDDFKSKYRNILKESRGQVIGFGNMKLLKMYSMK